MGKKNKSKNKSKTPRPTPSSSPPANKATKRASPGRAAKPNGPGRLILIIALVIAGAFVALNVVRTIPREGTEIDHSVAEEQDRPALTDADMAALGPYISARFAGGQADAASLPAVMRQAVPGVVGVTVRDDGRRIAVAWQDGASAVAALDAALAAVRTKVPSGRSPDVLEVTLGENFRTLSPGGDRRSIGNVYRGLLGVELIHKGNASRISPLDMVSQNRGFDKILTVFERQKKLPKGTAQTAEVRVRLFDADQLIVELGPQRATRAMRGNRLIDISEITAESTRSLANTMGDWLFRSLHEDGRETYKYWPSVEREAQSNNMIRQWMATVALGRVAADRQDDALFARGADNIRYNLSKFYREEGSFGLIEFRDQVKLGAVALAALSMIEHPQRQTFERWETALYNTTLELWNEGGKFNTFFKPKGADRNHNFYPGETLLYWAAQYEDKRDPALLEKFMASVEYYKDWHLNNRNPAFIPWHTQAYYKIWSLNHDEALRDWTFTMNDWLLGVQQWDDDARFPDTNGRFYDAHRPFGPPHASSTGVYLEGLIDAWRMAKEVGDKTRQESYRRAIVRGIRSIMQLAFLDEVDMFYISHGKRNEVLGGVRTTVYDNVIRVDNVQHALMGILKILTYFAPEDFRP